MRVGRLLRGPDNRDILEQLEERDDPFVPLAETSPHAPPRAKIDPDTSKSWLRRAWPVVKTHKGIWSLSLICSFVALLAQVQIPRFIGEAISDCLPTAGHTTDLKPLSSFATLIFVSIGVREVCNYLGRRCLLTMAYRFEYDLRHLMYDHYMSLSFPFYDRVSVGQLISRANSDVRAVQQYLVMAPTVLVQCAVIIVAFAEMFSLNAQLTLVTGLSLPITFAVGIAMRKKIYPVSWLIQARLADIAMLVEENISGVRVVKSFAAEQKEVTTLARAADKLQWSYIKDANIRGTWAPTLENLPRVGLAVILLYGGFLVLHDNLGVGTLFTFQAYMLIFQPPFRQLGMVIMNGQRASASAKRIYEVLDQRPEVVNRPGAVNLVDCRGDVHFDRVSFSYGDGTPVLHDFDLHIAPGETVALVGRTGSGKTTAGRLLNRSYDVSAGRLLVDGHDVRDYTLESLRANVGFVFDEPFLFSISVRDNIAYGRPGASVEEVRAAAQAADAEEFIVRLPQGYDTVIGERGYTLSGGQRQRLAIARTLLVNPPILILDDATSAIDAQVEQRIHGALRRLMASRTTLVIAHRLATIALADRVALVENGHVIATGAHARLLEDEPRYAEVLARVAIEDDGDGAGAGGGAGLVTIEKAER
ncbi:MAG TPA: ABC transporter ATP-binding protein [Acidimicrobiales bacterium]|nr:ABC transporter ATP-binding protein [Acidimicrobiales bacterium]